ncbi:MAG: LuxR C-terminal-related transcriptional regulator [Acidimicrobiia bacterium]
MSTSHRANVRTPSPRGNGTIDPGVRRTTDERDRALLEAIRRIGAARTLDGFAEAVAAELFALVPGLSTSYNEVRPDGPKAIAHIHPVPDPGWWDEYTAPFEAHLHEHPLLAHFAEIGDGPPTTWTDVDPDGAFFETALYRSFYRPLGIHSQIAFQVPSSQGVVVAVSVNRDGSPFTDDERTLLAELRAHLVNLHALVTLADRARLSIDLLGLSGRQADVAVLIQEGLTNTQIADRLGISASTVRKHIEAIFQTLGVQSRAAVVATILAPTDRRQGPGAPPPR